MIREFKNFMINEEICLNEDWRYFLRYELYLYNESLSKMNGLNIRRYDYFADLIDLMVKFHRKNQELLHNILNTDIISFECFNRNSFFETYRFLETIFEEFDAIQKIFVKDYDNYCELKKLFLMFITYRLNSDFLMSENKFKNGIISKKVNEIRKLIYYDAFDNHLLGKSRVSDRFKMYHSSMLSLYRYETVLKYCFKSYNVLKSQNISIDINRANPVPSILSEYDGFNKLRDIFSVLYQNYYSSSEYDQIEVGSFGVEIPDLINELRSLFYNDCKLKGDEIDRLYKQNMEMDIILMSRDILTQRLKFYNSFKLVTNVTYLDDVDCYIKTEADILENINTLNIHNDLLDEYLNSFCKFPSDVYDEYITAQKGFKYISDCFEKFKQKLIDTLCYLDDSLTVFPFYDKNILSPDDLIIYGALLPERLYLNNIIDSYLTSIKDLEEKINEIKNKVNKIKDYVLFETFQINNINNNKHCKKCILEPLYSPLCGHVLCSDCINELQICPICQKPLANIVDIRW